MAGMTAKNFKILNKDFSINLPTKEEIKNTYSHQDFYERTEIGGSSSIDVLFSNMISDNESVRDLERFRIVVGLNVDNIHRLDLEVDDVFFDDVHKMMNELFDDCIKDINDNIKAYHEGKKNVHEAFQELAKNIKDTENKKDDFGFQY